MKITESNLRKLIRKELLNEKSSTSTSTIVEQTDTDSDSDTDTDTDADGMTYAPIPKKDGLEPKERAVLDAFNIDDSEQGKVIDGNNYLSTLTSSAQTKLNEFFGDLSRAGISVSLNSGLRSITKQYDIWTDRNTLDGELKPGETVAAKPGLSNHNYGTAIDLNASYRTKDGNLVELKKDSSKDKWKPVSMLALRLGLTWGGDFLPFPKKYDPIHFDTGGSGAKTLYNKLVNLNNKETNPHKWDKSTLTKV